MPRWGCPTCRTVYALRLYGGCPRHPGTQLVEEAQMPKISRHGGPSDPVAEPGQPGYVEPPAPEAGEDTEPAAASKPASKPEPKTEEEPSPGNSSETSPPKLPPTPAPSGTAPRSRARTTGNR